MVLYFCDLYNFSIRLNINFLSKIPTKPTPTNTIMAVLKGKKAVKTKYKTIGIARVGTLNNKVCTLNALVSPNAFLLLERSIFVRTNAPVINDK